MNKIKIYTNQEAKEYAEKAAETLTVRTYENGSSKDTTRETTQEEKGILTNIIYGALLSIKWHKYDKTAVQIAKDTAEFTIDLMLPYINGYDSVYNKIGKFIEIYE